MMTGNPTAASQENREGNQSPGTEPLGTRIRRRTDGLRNSEGRAERGELQRDVEQDARLAYAAERLARRRERAIREEVKDLLSDPVL